MSGVGSPRRKAMWVKVSQDKAARSCKLVTPLFKSGNGGAYRKKPRIRYIELKEKHKLRSTSAKLEEQKGRVNLMQTGSETGLRIQWVRTPHMKMRHTLSTIIKQPVGHDEEAH